VSELIHSPPNNSALAWELRNLILQGKRHFLLPTTNLAYFLKSNLEAFLPELSVHLLPKLESDLIRNRGPQKATRVERIDFFYHLNKDTEKKIFLLPSESLSAFVPPLDFWKKNSFTINKGAGLDRDHFLKTLKAFGYQESDVVERHFEYAERGYILDFFSATNLHPIRVEIYDDQVADIRSFHTKNQRRIESFDSFELIPAVEAIYHPENSKIEAIKNELSELGIKNEERKLLIQRIQDCDYPYTFAYWTKFFHKESTMESDFQSFIHNVESATLFQSLKSSFIEHDKNFLTSNSENEWVPRVNSFVNDEKSVVSFISNQITQENSSWLHSQAHTALKEEPSQSKKSATKSTLDIQSQLREERAKRSGQLMTKLCAIIRQLLSEKKKIIISSAAESQLERLSFLLQNEGLSLKKTSCLQNAIDGDYELHSLHAHIHKGFEDTKNNFILLTDEDIFGEKKKKSYYSKNKKQSAHKEFTEGLFYLDLKPNECVVHKKHGVGKFLGLKTIDFEGIANDFFELEYKDGTIFLPIHHLGSISKHHVQLKNPQLDKLGGSSWEGKKNKVKKELQSLAAELLQLYSKRELSKAMSIAPSEESIEKFAASFPYTETEDQLKAIYSCLEDIKGPRPMNRLICGDVGYGKTEVSIRVAQAALSEGYNVAVLCPTTLLCAQHEKVFKQRLKDFKVKSVSRLKSTKENKETLAELAKGKVNLIIGTHRLLSNDVHFKKLGLLIVDEEQRFGVTHKEKIKKFKNNVHVLTLTATPIPRTLHFAMSGLMELSIISTPPQDRLSVKTFLAKKNDDIIQEALQKEIKRGGQAYYLYNRVETIEERCNEIKALLPGVKVEFVHGQMLEKQLEERMLNFYQGKTQVLVTTTIIESGLDVSNANTLFVEGSDRFGLSQLYQIRGRVGRSNKRAYAYFLLPEKHKLRDKAHERLKVLESYQELGSGFHIAGHDLDMRGTGDILGKKQSGSMNTLGYDAYMELLQNCIQEAKGEEILNVDFEPEMQLGVSTIIPDEYIGDTKTKLLFYKRLSSVSNEEDLKEISEEIYDRFGEAPETVENLYEAMKINMLLKKLGITSIKAGGKGYALFISPDSKIDRSLLIQAIQKYPHHFQLKANNSLFIAKDLGQGSKNAAKTLSGVKNALIQLESWML